jgi:tetratricopeptide (TPR) repeat protein
MVTAEDLGPLLEGVALPASLEAQVHAAAEALTAGRADDALRALEGAPTDVAAVPWLQGAAHLVRADFSRAAPLLERALSLQPDLSSAHLALALTLEVFEDFERAASHLRACLQRRSEDVSAIAGLARVYCRLDRLDRAEALARRGLELSPDHPALLKALADALRRQDRQAEAAVALRAALAVRPNDEATAIALGRTLVKLGAAYEAAPLFEAVLTRNGDSTGALAGVAESLQALGRHAEALGYLLRALAAAPDQAWLHLLSARLHLQTGELAAAEQAAAQAAALPGPDATRIEALRVAARAARAQGDALGAATYAERVLAWLDDDGEAQSAAALARVLGGEARAVEGALRAGLGAVDGRPSPDALVALGAALYCLGDSQAAAERAVAALKLSPEDTLARRLMALSYEPAEVDASARLERLRARFSPDEGRVAVPLEDGIGGAAMSRFGHRMTGPVPIVELAVHQLLGAESTLPRASVRPAVPLTGGAAERAPLLPAPAPGTGSIEASSSGEPSSLGSSSSGASASSGGAAEPSTPPTGEAELGRLRGVVERARRILDGAAELGSAPLDIERVVEGMDAPITLALVGPPGAGKTTLLNVLIGDAIVPTSSGLTHWLRYGRKAAARILFVDGAVETLAVETLKGALEARAAELTPARVRAIELVYPISELTRVNVVDVPGSADAADARAQSTLAEADAVLWLGGIDHGAEAWREAAQALSVRGRRALAVVTHIDGRPQAQIDAAVTRAMIALGRTVEDVVPLSAEVALKGLRGRDVEALRRSGVARLHRVLKARFFAQSALIRATTSRQRALETLRGALGWVEARERALTARLSTVSALSAQLGLDRNQLEVEVREDAPLRLRAALDRALRAAGQELVEIAREHSGPHGRTHALNALRRCLRGHLERAVERARDAVDARIDRVLHSHLARLDAAFEGEASAQAQRVPALRGLLDSHRLLLLEQRFGRYLGYLEGRVDVAALGEVFDALTPEMSSDTATHILVARGLNLDALPLIRLDGMVEPLFEGFAEFADETEAEVKVSLLELGTRFGETLRRVVLEIESLGIARA